MSKIYLQGLQCEAFIGVWAWEKQVKQTLTMDVTMETSFGAAASSDRLEDALNYQLVAERITAFTAESRVNLLETLVDQLAELVLDEFPVTSVTIKLDKGSAVKNVKNVGVILERTRTAVDRA